MKISITSVTALLFIFVFANCSSENPVSQKPPSVTTTPITVDTSIPQQLRYLALGDSYTIGHGVCETCKFPEQLRKKISDLNPKNTYTSKIIATTGWTTTNLLSEINRQILSSNYDLVTLLIGVNNQYQNTPFAIYEKEFPELVFKAIALAGGDKSNIIVVSIPDYAFTPFGKSGDATKISSEIDNYNAFAQKYCSANTIKFVNITDITRLGLTQPNLVASDGLHPSAEAYTKFVERILPEAIIILAN